MLVQAVRSILGNNMQSYTPSRIPNREAGTPIIFIEGASTIYVPLRYFSEEEKVSLYQARLAMPDLVKTPLNVLRADPGANPRETFTATHSLVFRSCAVQQLGDGSMILRDVPSRFPLLNEARLVPGVESYVVENVCARLTSSENQARIVEVFRDGTYLGVFTLHPEPTGDDIVDIVDISNAPTSTCFDEGVRMGAGNTHFVCARGDPEKSQVCMEALDRMLDVPARWDSTSVFLYAMRCAMQGGSPHGGATISGLSETARLHSCPATEHAAPPQRITPLFRMAGVAARLDAACRTLIRRELSEIQVEMSADASIVHALARDRLLKYPGEALISDARSIRSEVWLAHVKRVAIACLCDRLVPRNLP